MRRSHITQRNGASRMPLVDDIRPYEDQIRFTLNRMDGTTFWAWSLWRAPEGADLLEALPLSDEYLQCAGSAEAMTIELRMPAGDGAARQYTVGKPGGDADAAPETIPWDDGRRSTEVLPHEVFTADDAADVFGAYFRAGEVGAPYVLRRREDV